MTAKVKLFGHHAVIENAAGHVSVVLPKGHAGCGSGAAASSSSHAGGHGGGGKESGRFDSTGLHGVAEEDEAEGDGGHMQGAGEEDGEGSVEDEAASAAGSGSQPSNLAPVADIANSASFIQRYRTKLTVDGRLREVEIESRVHGCRLAINGGLFDTKTGSCHGSTVTGGRVASVSGRRNAHFGIVSSVPNDVSMRMAFEHRPDLHHPLPSPSASGGNSRSSDGSAAAAKEANEVEQYYPMRHGFMTGYLSESEVESLIDASAEQAEASWLNWQSSGEAAEDPEVARRNARRRSKDNVVIGADSLPPVTVTTTTVTGDDTGSQPMKRTATSTAINELVSGAVWLVRNGQPIAMSSATDIEDSRVQETSHSMSEFAKTQSARTAIGHDGHGRMIVSQLDGRSWWTGIDLDTFSQWLAAQGVASAINVDGGGSATMVSKGEVINSPTYACADSDTQPQGSIPSGKTGLRGRAAAGALDTQHAEAQQYNTDAKPGKNFHCVRPVSSIICVHDAPAMPRVVRRPAPPAGDGPARHVLQLELSNGCVCTDSVVAAEGAADALSVTQLASIVTTAGEEEEESDDSRRQLRQGRRLSQPVMSPRCMCTGVDAGGDPSVREHFIVRLVPTAKSMPGGSGGSDATTRPSPSAVKAANDADDDGGDAEAPTSRASTAPSRSQRPRPAATDSIPTMSATPKPSKAVPPTAASVAAKASPTRAAKATAEAQASAAGAVSGLGDDDVDAETETSPMPVRGASSTAAGNVKRSPSAAASAAGNAKASTAPLVPSTVPRAPSRTASPSTAAGAKAAGGSDSAKARGTAPPLAASPKANAAAASSPAQKASSTSSKAPKRPDDNGEGHGSDDAFDADNAFESADIAEALRHQLGAPVSSASASPLVKTTKTAVLR